MSLLTLQLREKETMKTTDIVLLLGILILGTMVNALIGALVGVSFTAGRLGQILYDVSHMMWGVIIISALVWLRSKRT